MIRIARLSLAKITVLIGIWYFIGYTYSGSMTQVGPFASQSACENYRTTNGFYSTTPCWDSKAK